MGDGEIKGRGLNNATDLKQLLQRKLPVLFQKDNKEKTGRKRITKRRRLSSHGGCEGWGVGAAPWPLTQRGPCRVPGSWENPGSTRENPPGMESRGCAPVHMNKDSVREEN